MNFEGKGLNICKIKNNNNTNDIDDINIYIADKKDYTDLKYIVPKINLLDADEIMQHLPYSNTSSGNTRQILYVSGASGSGKSHYCSYYMKEYNKQFPKNPIFIFSSLEKDKKLDEIKNTNRIKLDEKFYNTPFSIEDFKNCLIVYDDTEMISNTLIQEKITNILNLILTTGRHTGTYLIFTSHVANQGRKTKLILAESHSITLFLITMGDRDLKYLLENSFGFNTKQIRKIKSIDSRWITIFRTAPITIMYEKGIFTVNKNTFD